ncbi:hypothetical protein [Methyloglobulus sp.]|uniref:hypothetical protein n=1 Tax=Methyloglobulus sp. TaxID=2518622 RepID=UPI0032B72124
MESFHVGQLNLPHQFSKIERNEQDGVLAIENYFFQIADMGQLRVAHTYAAKVNVIAVFFFPECGFKLPVYSMEFVILGQKPIVVLMDTVCLSKPMPISGVVKDILASAHLKYPQFSQVEELPQWFQECRSGHEFFHRPHDTSEFLTLGEIHLSLIENLVKLFHEVEVFGKEQAVLHKARLEQYKKHHEINSPGTRLMNRSFGEEWTNEYLANYLFS